MDFFGKPPGPIPISSGQYELNGLRRLDPQAIATVYDSLYPDVYRFVAYRLREAAPAEELATRALILLLEQIRAGQQLHTRLKGWLLEAAARLSIEHLQTQRLRGKTASLLTEEQQQVLALRIGLGCSPEETAGLMKKNALAVKRLLFHTLDRLQAQAGPDAAIDDPLCEALEACLQLLERGADVELTLARFPARAAKLRPLLVFVLEDRNAAVRDVSVEVLQRGRAQVLRRAAEMRAQDRSLLLFFPFLVKPNWWSHFIPTAAGSVATATVLVAGSAGLLYTAAPATVAERQRAPVSRSNGPALGSRQPVADGLSLERMPAPASKAGWSGEAQPSYKGPEPKHPRVSPTPKPKPTEKKDPKPGKDKKKTPKPHRHPGNGDGKDHGGGHGHGHGDH